MNVTIPPVFFYALGSLLIVFGALRALSLGRRREERALDADSPALAKERRRHLTFGLLWVAMGVFLIVSTLGVIRMRAPF